MPTIKLNDIEVYYERHGEGHPLVLIAGYACDHTFWTLMQARLAQKFQVLIFDNRAIGQTKDDGLAFTLETMGNDVILLIQQLKLMRPHIVGHSLGATIAMIIGKKYPEQINKMVLLNAAAKLSTRSADALLSILNLRKQNVPIDLLIENSMPWFFSSEFLDKEENIVAFKTALMSNPYFQSISNQERQLNALIEFDARNWLERINTQTMIVASHDDILNSQRDSQQLKDHISSSQLMLVPGGHSSPIEEPHKVCEIIFNFLI